MWWEYIIIFAALGLAVSYVVSVMWRAFDRADACGSSGCRCGPHRADASATGRRVRVTPLVQLGSRVDDHRSG